MTFVKDSKWDRGEPSAKVPIGEQDKQLMADYLQAGLKMDKPRDVLLEELAKKYQRSPRQIERYIAEIRRRKDTSREQQANEREKFIAVIQKCRQEVISYSVANLLQWWLDKTDEGASIRYYTDEDVEKLYSESRDHHAELPRAKPFLLQVEKGPVFGLLRQKCPASDIWTLFDSWHEQTIPYTTALFLVLERVRRLLVREVGMPYSEFRERGLAGLAWVDGIGNISFDKMCQLERRAMVLLTCDLLLSRIAEFLNNSCWAHLVNELRELQLRMNLELSGMTDMVGEGGWPSRIRGIRARLADHPRELTQEFLDELAQWQSTQDSLLEALKKLESRI